MANHHWSPFYWGDYIADTGHLSLAEHGAYLLLMAHYYRTRRPLDANASVLHRVCRCTTDADKVAVEQVLKEFFVLDRDKYRHHRIDSELIKAAGISEVRRAAAHARHQKPDANAPANAPANAVQVHTQPQPQPQKTNTKARGADAPSFEQVAAYCLERGNHVDPQQWIDHYIANGWKVGRNPMRDWKAAVRTWEKNGLNKTNGNRSIAGYEGWTRKSAVIDEPQALSTYSTPELLMMQRQHVIHKETVPPALLAEIERRQLAN